MDEELRAEEVQPASLRNFLIVLFKRKKIIITFFLTVVAVVTGGSFLMPAIYQSESKLMIEKEIDSEKALLFRMNLNQGYNNYDFINSEMEILNSYPIAQRVVQSFESDLLPEDYGSLTAQEQQKVYKKTISEFQKKIEIENPKNSTILIIRYENKDPQLAMDIVNYFIDCYIAYRSEISAESESYKFLQDQMEIADDKLSTLEQRQADFKEQKEVGSPEMQRTILLTRLTDYEKSLTAVQTKRIGKEAKLSVFNEQVAQKGQNINIPSTETSDSPSREKYIAKLKGELLDLEIRKEHLLQKYTPQYEEVVNLEKQISATKMKIESEIQQIIAMEETAIRALEAEERVLQSQVNKIKSELRNLAQKEFEFDKISRGISDEREIYSMLLKQREEARLSMAKLERGVKIKVISAAVVPTEPVKPKKRLNVALAVFLGLFGGLGLAFFIEYFDHSINTPEELERFAGVPALGSVREIAFYNIDDSASRHAIRIMKG